MERSLQSYAERVRNLPQLNEAEERALAYRWQQTGDEQARNLLVQSQLRFVLSMAQRYRRVGLPLSDLVAEGNLGLLHAVNKFDPARGFRFYTYAKHWVRVYVSQCALRGSSCVVRNPRSLRKVRRELARATGLVGEGSEVRPMLAARLAITLAEVDVWLGLLEQHEIPLEVLTAERRLATDAALCTSEANPEQAVLRDHEAQLREGAVRGALATLSARERRIADRRLMVDTESMLTLKQLGEELGISRERVRQLELRLKQKLADHLSKSADVTERGCEAAA